MPRPYHGYGPDGYKPGPYHGANTNLDWAERARKVRSGERIQYPLCWESNEDKARKEEEGR
jgi:hypothetical protein